MNTVTVTVLVPQSTQGNTVDHITFSATASGTTTSLTVNLKVITTIDTQVCVLLLFIYEKSNYSTLFSF